MFDVKIISFIAVLLAVVFIVVLLYFVIEWLLTILFEVLNK